MTPDLSRRSILQIGALAVVKTPKPSLVLADPSVPIGVNHNYFPQFTRRIPGACAVRIYIGEYGHVPAAWPDRLPSATSLLGGPLIPPGTQTVLSVRPFPWDVETGKLDGAVRSLARSAPPGSRLAAWHEAGPGNPMGYPQFINAGSMTMIHEHMQRLCRGTNVRYGSIICGPANQLKAWLGHRLDWYGLDWFLVDRYLNRDGTMDVPSFENRMHHNLETWRDVAGQLNPSIVIPETNAPHDRNRIAVFTAMSAWLAKHGGPNPAMTTYWNPKHDAAHGGLSGPWPPSRPVIDQLRYLVRKYG